MSVTSKVFIVSPIILGVVVVYLYPSLLLYPSQISFFTSKSCLTDGKVTMTKEQLLKYDGTDGSKGLYLAFLGKIYDVDKGYRHYGPGGSYSHFAGKDATRGFITGDFSHDSLTDDILDLELSSISGVREWIDFYQREYPNIGVVIGSYYDASGCETENLKLLHKKFDQYDEMQKKKQIEEQEYPPCNSEWSQETGVTRIWCSPMSGGVKRDWAGVPRQIETKDGTRCGCVNLQTEQLGVEYAENEENESDGQNDKKGPPYMSSTKVPAMKEYPGCNPKAAQCLIYDKDKN